MIRFAHQMQVNAFLPVKFGSHPGKGIPAGRANKGDGCSGSGCRHRLIVAFPARAGLKLSDKGLSGFGNSGRVKVRS